MVTQVHTSANESATAVQEHVEEVVLSEAALAEAEEILRLREQAGTGSPWARFQHWLADRYGELAGRPMTDQERFRALVDQAARDRQSTGFMWW